MASCYAKPVDGTLDIGPTGYSQTYQFHYVGDGVGAGGVDISEGVVRFTFDDNAAACAEKVGQAARTEAAALGFEVERDRVVTPSVVRA